MTIDYWYITSFAKSVRDAEESGAKKKNWPREILGGGGEKVPRSPAIIWKHASAVVCDRDRRR